MNNFLLNAIHKYAEDREIDYIAAQIIGEEYGKKFKSQDDLIEWKQLIDRYLKTFNAKDFEAIEEELHLNEKCDKKDGTGNREGNRDGSGPGMYKRKKKKISKENLDEFKSKFDDEQDEYQDEKCPKCKKKMKKKSFGMICPSCGYKKTK